MHYLIDGHNLIGKLPDLSLQEARDEVELILRLKSWASAKRQRKVTVLFDRGLPGGTARMLSNRDVTVVFAPQGQTADSLLMARIKKIQNPPEFTLISSDQQIINTANKRKMRHIRSEDFAAQLGYDERLIAKSEPEATAEKPDVDGISDSEVREWLELFGPVPERPQPPPKRRQAKPAPETKPDPPKPKKRQPLTIAKAGNRELDEEEIAEWLALFGEVKEQPSPPPTTKSSKPTTKPKKRRPSNHLRTMKTDDVELHADEVDDWLDLFGRG